MDYNEFERDWLKRHRGSIVNKPRISSWGLIGGIMLWALIATGAALVSGAHSVPAILQTIPPVITSPTREVLSLFGFTIFELLIFAGAMYRRENRYAGWALWVALIGALAANIGSSIYATTVNKGDWLNMVVAVILAVVAPLAAFLAGEMVHTLKTKHDGLIKTAMDAYEIKRKDLDSIINREFTKYEKAQVEKEAAERKAAEKQALHEISRDDFMKSGEKSFSQKPRVKLHEVAKTIHENGDGALGAEAMAEKYQISLGSTTKVREILKAQSGSTNGNGNHG